MALSIIPICWIFHAVSLAKSQSSLFLFEYLQLRTSRSPLGVSIRPRSTALYVSLSGSIRPLSLAEPESSSPSRSCPPPLCFSRLRRVANLEPCFAAIMSSSLVLAERGMRISATSSNRRQPLLGCPPSRRCALQSLKWRRDGFWDRVLDVQCYYTLPGFATVTNHLKRHSVAERTCPAISCRNVTRGWGECSCGIPRICGALKTRLG